MSYGKINKGWNNFFEKADEIVLKENEPLKLAFEFANGAKEVAEKLVMPLRVVISQTGKRCKIS